MGAPGRGQSFVSCADVPQSEFYSEEQFGCGSQRDQRLPLLPTSSGPVPRLMSRAILTGYGSRTTAFKHSDMDDEASGTFRSCRNMRPRTLFRRLFIQIPLEVMRIHFHKCLCMVHHPVLNKPRSHMHTINKIQIIP